MVKILILLFMKGYSRKISTRLFNKFYLLISFIILISIAGLLCIQLLKTTSSEIVFEYMELDAVHNLQNSFHETFLPAYHYLIYKDSNELDKFNEKILESKNQLAYCKQFLRKSHNTDFLVYFNNYLAQFEHIVVHSGKNDFNISSNKKLIDRLQQMLKQANLKIESLKLETKHEIDIHIKTNTTSATHSSVTIILLTLSITLIGIYPVNNLESKLTTPLNELVNTTKIIGGGNLSVKTNINTHDEFEILGNSFNSMVAKLENSTISVNYFNNILT